MSKKANDKATRDVLETDEDISKNGLRSEYNTSWAVVIGINKYQHLHELKYAVADAEGIAELLKTAFGFPPEQVLLRCDGEANRDALREIFSDIVPKKTTSDDRVLIFFAGHGQKRKLPSGDSRGYLAPVDAEPDKWHTFVEIKELTDVGQLSAAKHVFYILDACYSGLATARGDEQPTRFQRDMLTHKARQALTAGLDDQVVDDTGPGNHSIFTYHLLEGLNGAANTNKDNVITGTELINYVKTQVGTDTESQQTPDYGLLPGHESGGDFVFFLKRTPRLPAEITEALTSRDPYVRLGGINALGIPQDSEDALRLQYETLADILLNDELPEVRSQSAQALGQLNIREAVVPLTTALLKDPDSHVRSAVVKILGGLSDYAGVKKFLYTSLTLDANPEVRLQAAKVLDMVAAPRTIPDLGWALSESEDTGDYEIPSDVELTTPQTHPDRRVSSDVSSSQSDSTVLSLQRIAPIVYSVLGNSFFYAEHKGDFAYARRLAQEKLKEAQQRGDASVIADALLVRGIVHLLQGEPPAAIRCFQELEQIVPNDYDRRLCAVSYANLATFWHYNAFPDGSGANATELWIRWNGEEYLKAEIPRRQAIFAQASQMSARFESQMVNNFLSSLQSSRAFLQTSLYQSGRQFTEQLLEFAQPDLMQFRQSAEMYGAPPLLLAYVGLEMADLHRRAGQLVLANESLLQAFAAYLHSGDLVGVATCQMLRADWLVAPHNTPLVWNQILSNPIDEEFLYWEVESTTLSRAQHIYSQVAHWFDQTSAWRGQAALQLRYSYLAALEGDYARVVEHATQAEHRFEAIGDLSGAWIARVHKALGLIRLGKVSKAIPIAQSIGRWGRVEGSFSFVLGLGLMLTRVGRQWSLREGSNRAALTCYCLARALFHHLGAHINEAESLAEQANLHITLEERKKAFAIYEQALDLYEQGMEERPEIIGDVRQQMIMLANDVYRLYLDGMNADGMQRSADRIRKQVAQPPDGDDGLGAGAQLPDSGLSGIETFALGNLARSTIEQAGVFVPLYKALEARDKGDQEEVEQLFQEALSVARAANEAQRDFLEAIVFAHQRAYDQAIASFNRYLAQGSADAGLAGALVQAVGEEQGQQEALRQQGHTYEQAFTFMVRVKAYAAARQYLEKLEELEGKDWWQRNDQPWLPLSDCAAMYTGLGKWKAALDYYGRAIEELDKRRSQLGRYELKNILSAGRGVEQLYSQAAHVALTLAGQADDRSRSDQLVERAFDYAERGKAEFLSDLVAGGASVAGSPYGESQTLTAWYHLNECLQNQQALLARQEVRSSADYLQQQITDNSTDLKWIEAELAIHHPNFHRLIQPEIIPIREIPDLLASDTALLQYFFAGDELLAWAVTGRGANVVHRVKVETSFLERQIRMFHQSCENMKALESSAWLAETLLKPMAEVIQSHSNLIVIPYGTTHTLPFAALPWEGQPLIASRSCAHLSSASMLQDMNLQGLDELPDRILTVGDPASMSYQLDVEGQRVAFDSMPPTATEASIVASLFSEGEVLVGDQATKGAVRKRLSECPILHFATDCWLSEEAPLQSSILLAGGDLLTVFELISRNLQVDLIEGCA